MIQMFQQLYLALVPGSLLIFEERAWDRG